MRIALLSATKLSLQPIENAIQQFDENIEFFHLLDSSLITMLKKDGMLSERIVYRFKQLCDISVENGADCIQLTCSAFNDVTTLLKPHYAVPIYRSDEGMVQKALAYQHIGIVSTFAETPEVLKNYIHSLAPHINVTVAVNTALMQAFEAGNQDVHDAGVMTMIEELEQQVDAIILAQYSIAHVAKLKAFQTPVITAPDASIELCLHRRREMQ